MLKATHEIKFPEERTYWIAYTNTEIFSYGYIDSDQELSSGQPNLWTTLDESKWLYKLKKDFNTIPDETN
jgi:hypothetical protein